MNTFIKALAATALAVSVSAPAFSAVSDDIRRSAGTNGHINVAVDGDTVTLTGYVEDSYAKSKAESVAEREGYEVNNYLILK